MAALAGSLIVLALLGNWIVVSRFVSGALSALTALLFLGICGSLLFAMLEVSTTLLRISRDTKNRLRLLLATTLILLFGVELILRYGFRRYATYPELNGFGYGTLYQRHHTSWLFTFETVPKLDYSKIEFAYTRKINSLGLCEREIPLAKGTGEYRVVALGDSFTEGVGASYDSTWVKVLERHLAAAMPDRQVTTINAGVSGSDSFYQYVLLRDKLLAFKPDLVIVALNPTDVNDVIIRGGMERFLPDGSTRYVRNPPRWEWAYATSYIVRVIVHDLLKFNWLLMKESRMESAKSVALEELVSVLTAFQELSEDNDFDLLVVLHPSSFMEVVANRYANDLGRVISLMSHDERIHILDLLDHYRRTGIIVKENARSFFWPLDGHHNTEGYRVMGDAIAQEVLRPLFVPRWRRDGSRDLSVRNGSLGGGTLTSNRRGLGTTQSELQ
jgi:lysophospholipase L1-like esterase